MSRQHTVDNRQEDLNSTASGLQSTASGFTIIEMIVSVSVFAVAMTAMVGVFVSVQRLNAESSALQEVQRNGRFAAEDITKIIRNGQIDYTRYSDGTAPAGSTRNLYLIDSSGQQVRIYRTGQFIKITRGSGDSRLTSNRVEVTDFDVYVWPRQDPFDGGSVQQQPTATVYFELESDINQRDRVRIPFQVTAVTRQYPE